MKAGLHVSDPWEFGTEVGVGPFAGEVIEATEARIIFRLETGWEYKGKFWDFLFVTFRHENVSVKDFLESRNVSVNVSRCRMMEIDHGKAFVEIDDFRKAHSSLIGNIQLENVGVG